jgi:hypothetical protein
MREINLAVINDESLKIVMEEFLGKSIYFYEYKTGKDINIISKLEEDMINIVVIDKELYNINNTLEMIKNSNIKVIYAGFNSGAKEIKKYWKNGYISDYIEKSEFTEIEQILKEIKWKGKKKKKIVFSGENSSEIVVNIENIYHIYYDRISRKSVIATENGEFHSKKNMSEMEELFSNYESFVRIDRGTIVNSDRIAEIDYRNEFIRFDNMKKIGVGSKSLKSFRKDIYMWEEGS